MAKKAFLEREEKKKNDWDVIWKNLKQINLIYFDWKKKVIFLKFVQVSFCGLNLNLNLNILKT